jgi:6-pyruvoyltetrahydropterin/6-carboxytetrahydropterin synthase
MPLTLMRRIRFCSGHRLFRHGGKCEFFHGHNYMADFFVTGDEVDEVGRVVDFAELKRILKGWIDENWDHAFILSEEDKNGIEAIKMVVPTKYYLLPFNPTAENMAMYLVEKICPQLFDGMTIRATKVIIWETEEAYSEATIDGISDPCSAGFAEARPLGRA